MPNSSVRSSSLSSQTSLGAPSGPASGPSSEQSQRYAIIMAGGSGTRFWPASRTAVPKQFLSLGPNPMEPLLVGTVRRIREVVPASNILIATGTHLADATRRLLPELPPDNILAEPTPRNTAPCIAWANAVIRRRAPNAAVAVLSADHVAQDEAAFVCAIEQALSIAESGVITTIGIVPTRPETGYGYIEKGSLRADGAYDAVRFVEKPNLETAIQMVASDRFLWNAGVFFFRAQQMADAIRTHLPLLADGVDALDAAAEAGEESEALCGLFPTFPSVSIDVGVMEKISSLAVVPGSFGWSDVGTWQTAWEVGCKDEHGNVAPRGSIVVGSSGNMVADWRTREPAGEGFGNRVVALVGVKDLVVVQTDDALLVMPRERSQDVRLVVESLRERGMVEKL
ncbi:MAG: sugar phosphate nucleotidyltransferase [Polyangiaceae bacterium]|nr:sugar phosphate nucleotidyltransferase [Polyangiaceae bacterium]